MITQFLSDQKPYLTRSYSIYDFAKDVGVPMRKISGYVNRHEQLNFRDFINRSRIEYCIKNLNEGEWQNLTLETIARECGFNNRNSFTTAFRKFSGTNPSSFISGLKRHHDPGS